MIRKPRVNLTPAPVGTAAPYLATAGRYCERLVGLDVSTASLDRLVAQQDFTDGSTPGLLRAGLSAIHIEQHGGLWLARVCSTMHGCYPGGPLAFNIKFASPRAESCLERWLYKHR